MKNGIEFEIRWLKSEWINGENSIPGNPFKCNGYTPNLTKLTPVVCSIISTIQNAKTKAAEKIKL